MIKSPVSHSNNTRKIKSFDVKDIQQMYKNDGVDVAAYFKDISTLDLYECLDSGLQFFYPHTIVGDGKFYEILQNFDWYYADEKWEFKQGLSLISPESKVLEIGSGRGQFLNLLRTKTKHAEGLELNESALAKIKANGLTAHYMKIDEFEKTLSPDQLFDVVCSFQVYEHIDNIGEVIQSSLNALKVGGKLIISVPNSDCPFNNPTLNQFNMPPHHQGLWFGDTFKKLPNTFNINLLDIYYEPTSFLNIFRAARFYSKVMAKEGNAKSMQFFHSLQKIFKSPALQKGRTMLAHYEKM